MLSLSQFKETDLIITQLIKICASCNVLVSKFESGSSWDCPSTLNCTYLFISRQLRESSIPRCRVIWSSFIPPRLHRKTFLTFFFSLRVPKWVIIKIIIVFRRQRFQQGSPVRYKSTNVYRDFENENCLHWVSNAFVWFHGALFSQAEPQSDSCNFCCDWMAIKHTNLVTERKSGLV